MDVPMLKGFKNRASGWLRDESGQSTTEYVLLVLILVMAVKTVGNTFKQQLTGLVGQVFQQAGTAAQEVGRD
jgi:Flp pilus assembly pilin Flp